MLLLRPDHWSYHGVQPTECHFAHDHRAIAKCDCRDGIGIPLLDICHLTLSPVSQAMVEAQAQLKKYEELRFLQIFSICRDSTAQKSGLPSSITEFFI